MSESLAPHADAAHRAPCAVDRAHLWVGLVLLGFGLWWSQPRAALRVGTRAPAVNLPSVFAANERVAIGGKGQGLRVVEFFSGLCSSCEETLPRLQARARAADVTWVSVSTDETVGAAATAARRLGLQGAVVHDSLGRATAAFGVEVIPTVFLVDRKGVIVARLSGAVSPRSLEDALARARSN